MILWAFWGCGAPTPAGSSGDQGAPLGDQTTGSAACARCHADVYEAWASSHHALAQRPASPDDPALSGLLELELDGGEGPARFPVRWTLGVAPLRQFVVPMTGGRHQVTQQAWDTDRAEWFDVFGDDRQPGEWGHWTGRGMTWNGMCAPCHTTGLVVGYDPEADTFSTTWHELGVGCEACHGPGSAHGDEGAPSPGGEACAACHARMTALTGAYSPTEPLLDHFLPALPDTSDTWHADGQVQDELFEAVAFRMSRMHEAGVTCRDCHDAHTGALRAEGDGLCLSCHAEHPGFARHDHHGGAVSCVDCHMPRTVYMQRHPRRDHGMHLPDPALAAEIGAPSACGRCHDEDVKEAAARWWPGLAERPHRLRARAVAAARRGEGPDPLLAALPEANPTWRAALVGLLGPWAADPRAEAHLRAAAADPDPWVRLGAAHAWSEAGGPPALLTLLDDPVRAVRVQAALGLRHRLSPSDPRAADLRAWLERDLHQPQARTLLAGWLLQHGDPVTAERWVRPAVSWDPSGTGARLTLAVALASQGRVAQAREVLEDGVQQHPTDAELRFRLALARAGEGDLDGGRRELEILVGMAPDHGRAWYNLGLVRDRLGDLDGAVAALQQADAQQPVPPDALWALTTLIARAEPERARILAQEVLSRDPGHREARAWLARWGGR